MIKEIDDLAIVNSFFKDFFSNYNNSDDPFEHFFGYFINNNLIGLISVSKIYERAEINYIAVCQQYRNKGIGKKLIDYGTKGFSVISLEVSSKNTSAIDFYLKNGFIKKAVRKEYYGMTDAYLMVKEVR